MKKILLLAIISMSLLTSCTYQLVPLKGKYQHNSIIIEKPFDEVWSSVIDVISENGDHFDYIEKENGLITFKTYYTYLCTNENLDGIPIDPEAFFVLPCISSDQTYKYDLADFNKVFFKWNIRVKQMMNKTKVTINFCDADISYKSNIFQDVQIGSLGKFEKMFFDKLK